MTKLTRTQRILFYTTLLLVCFCYFTAVNFSGSTSVKRPAESIDNPLHLHDATSHSIVSKVSEIHTWSQEVDSTSRRESSESSGSRLGTPETTISVKRDRLQPPPRTPPLPASFLPTVRGPNIVSNHDFAAPLHHNPASIQEAFSSWRVDGKSWHNVSCVSAMGTSPSCSHARKQVLGVDCSHQFVRAALQFIPIVVPPHLSLRSLDVRLTVAGVDISVAHNSKGRPIAGLYARIRFRKPSSTVDIVDAPSNNTATANTTHDRVVHIPVKMGSYGFATAHREVFVNDVNARHPVESVTLMLTCFGHKGHLYFDSVVVEPILEVKKSVSAHGQSLIELDAIADNNKRVSIVPGCPPYYTAGEHTFRQAFHVSVVQEFPRRSSVPHSSDSVTLAIHGTVNRLATIALTLQIFKGPVSLAIYTDHMNRSEADVAVRERLLNGHTCTPSRCRLVVVTPRDAQRDIEYPGNMLRNMALEGATITDYVFPLDSDFVPSPLFPRLFASTLKALSDSQRNRLNLTAFVVPAFELNSIHEMQSDGSYNVPADVLVQEAQDRLPTHKREIQQAMRNKTMDIFQFVHKPAEHNATNYARWFRSSDLYPVATDGSDGTGYSLFHYEPFVVVHRQSPHLPRYDERFTGFGMNKVSWVMSLAAAHYHFLVLPEHFVTHVAHDKTNAFAAFLTDVDTRLLNRVHSYEYLANAIREHHLADCAHLKAEKRKDILL